MTVHVLCALPHEAAALTRPAPATASTVALGPGVTLTVTGMGAEAAGRAATALLAGRAAGDPPPLLVSFGVAGALDDTLAAGDVVVASRVVDAGDAARHAGAGEREGGETGAVPDPAVAARLAAALAAEPGLRVVRGTLLTTGAVLASAAAKREHAAPDVVAADMESAAIALAAARAGAGFQCLRAIVDDARMTLPATALACLDGDGRVSPVRLAAGLLRRPGDLLGLLRLGRAFASAQRSLQRSRPALLALAGQGAAGPATRPAA